MYTLQSQYSNSNIQTLLDGLDNIATACSSELAANNYRDFIDISTATGEALDAWGKDLNIPRNIPSPTTHEIDRAGFSLTKSNFYQLQFDFDTNISYLQLTDQAMRVLLKLRFLELSTNATIPQINEYMTQLFAQFGGAAYIDDPQNMSFATYIFNFEIPYWLDWCFKHLDILPRPAGIGLKVTENIVYPIGFDGQDPIFTRQVSNFFKSNFYHGKTPPLDVDSMVFEIKPMSTIIGSNKQMLDDWSIEPLDTLSGNHIALGG